MEHRTLLSAVKQRHNGVKTRWNIGTVELDKVEHRHGGTQNPPVSGETETCWSKDTVEHRYGRTRHDGIKTRWNIDTVEHRTLLSVDEQRHAGVITRWNIGTAELDTME